MISPTSFKIPSITEPIVVYQNDRNGKYVIPAKYLVKLLSNGYAEYVLGRGRNKYSDYIEYGRPIDGHYPQSMITLEGVAEAVVEYGNSLVKEKALSSIRDILGNGMGNGISNGTEVVMLATKKPPTVSRQPKKYNGQVQQTGMTPTNFIEKVNGHQFILYANDSGTYYITANDLSQAIGRSSAWANYGFSRQESLRQYQHLEAATDHKMVKSFIRLEDVPEFIKVASGPPEQFESLLSLVARVYHVQQEEKVTLTTTTAKPKRSTNLQDLGLYDSGIAHVINKVNVRLYYDRDGQMYFRGTDVHTAAGFTRNWLTRLAGGYLINSRPVSGRGVQAFIRLTDLIKLQKAQGERGKHLAKLVNLAKVLLNEGTPQLESLVPKQPLKKIVSTKPQLEPISNVEATPPVVKSSDDNNWILQATPYVMVPLAMAVYTYIILAVKGCI